MNVLFASSPIIGHVNPLLVAARILKKAGHTIAFYTGTQFRNEIESAGVCFFPLPTDVDYDAQSIHTMLKQSAPGPEQMALSIKGLFINALPSQFGGLQALLDRFAADLIVYESIFLGVLPLLLGPRSARPSCAYLGISTLLLPREDGAPFGPGLRPATSVVQREHYRSIARDIDGSVTHPLREYTDQRLGQLGAEKLPAPLFESMTLLADLILQPCVPSFEYPLREVPDKLHFIGSLVPEGSGDVPSEVDKAREAGRRVVLVSQGTIANRDLGKLLSPAMEALRDRDDLLILVTTGGRPISSIPCPLPANTVASQFINFRQVFPLIDVLVAFGGYGTVTQALSFGVPMVLAGQGEDKPETAARVVWTGTGVSLGTDNPTPTQIRDGVDEILSDPGYRARARELSLEFAAYDSGRELTNLVERLVDSPQVAVQPLMATTPSR